MYSPYGFPNSHPGAGAPPPGAQNTMFNPQQFMAAQQGGASFPGNGASPGMMGGSPGGMQNPAMMQMPANGQMAYQTPYTSSPYGPNILSPAGPQPQLPPNYMMAGAMPQFQMNAGVMPALAHTAQQQMLQRAAMSPQRPFNPQGTPTSALPPQSGHYSSPQPQGPPQSQTPTSAQPQPHASVPSPQTPTFASAGQSIQPNGTPVATTPLSPGTESREKERFSVLLEINQELLIESIQLQNLRVELKKEQQAAADSGEPRPKSVEEQEKWLGQDYATCMRRLQNNLAYMATLTKGVQMPTHPHLMPPPLNLNLRMRPRAQSPAEAAANPQQPSDANKDREERDRYLKELYKKLQSLYPGVDPRKEPSLAVTNARPGQQVNRPMPKPLNGQMPGGLGPSNGSPVPGGHPEQAIHVANAATAAPVMQAQAAAS